ncbi:acyl-CoA hydrolase [Tamaricihabitans halophyticus]|uniref:Acyl-CoA hydrolase n=1 Tax=Tamaricihabitans halophyticus TaxID=1262583 RepID=A0A4R2QMH2_9PSEU|nr:acetyl-CoA hydrolase/transferase C-terminal domain-containing protein [Tamaricihabitans halophyticus]TCP50750.1 acyl-CoA hydrolase [Tamaricihabitans halophyticus]
MSTFDITKYLRPGDTVVVGQAAAEPPELVAKLIEAAVCIPDLTALCGYTVSDAWAGATESRPTVKSYVAHGGLRELSDKGLLQLVPWNYSRFEELLTSGHLRADVVLLQVGPPDDDGYYSLGATVDYAVVAAERARVVLVEVNPNMPRPNAARRLHSSLVTASISTSRALAGSPARAPSEVERDVAVKVAELVPSGATIQLGVGALAEAIGWELRGHRGLRVRSGLVGDWLVDLQEAGALDAEPGSCVVGMAVGTERLYRFLDESDIVYLAPITEQISPEAISRDGPLVAINAAIEVDLLGQVNSEAIGDRYVGGIGGQLDFFRACRASAGGMAIVALAATAPSGTGRIVGQLSGPVTTPKSDIDVVVTEWGAADIRACSLSERAEALARLADPRHRAELRASRPNWA